jgi:hypothetical protein
MIIANNNFVFAGVGFTLLSLDTGTVNVGSLSDGSSIQPLSNVTFDGATGAISFYVPDSPTAGVNDITFSGNTISDDFGNAIGFTGTWAGWRVEREEPALRVHPPRPGPPIFEVGGLWAGVIDRDEI